MHNNESSTARKCARPFVAFLFSFRVSRKCEFVSYIETQQLYGERLFFCTSLCISRLRNAKDARRDNLSLLRARCCFRFSFFFFFFIFLISPFQFPPSICPPAVRGLLIFRIRLSRADWRTERERERERGELIVVKSSLRAVG